MDALKETKKQTEISNQSEKGEKKKARNGKGERKYNMTGLL